MKSLEQLIEEACRTLVRVGVEDARMESEFLLAAYLDVPRTRVILDRHLYLSAQKAKGFQDWVERRQRRIPLAYVAGEQPFRDLRVKTTPDVLIPRPETELLVEQALRLLDRGLSGAVVVDVGTGSGCIAISLGAHANVGRVIGIDLSKAALKVARKNEKSLRRCHPIEWVQGDLLQPLEKRRVQADMIVANLPYIRTADLANLAPELQWEPRSALDGGPDGLRLIDSCIQQAERVLRPGGVMLLEIGWDQGPAVQGLCAQRGAWENVQFFKDLSGHTRIVQAARRSA